LPRIHVHCYTLFIKCMADFQQIWHGIDSVRFCEIQLKLFSNPLHHCTMFCRKCMDDSGIHVMKPSQKDRLLHVQKCKWAFPTSYAVFMVIPHHPITQPINTRQNEKLHDVDIVFCTITKSSTFLLQYVSMSSTSILSNSIFPQFLGSHAVGICCPLLITSAEHLRFVVVEHTITSGTSMLDIHLHKSVSWIQQDGHFPTFSAW
jgi:hypothetical protein